MNNDTFLFKGNHSPLSKEQMEILAGVILVDAHGKQVEFTKEKQMPFLSQVVQRRIEVMKLPIKFDNNALLAINSLTDVPGGAVVILIDALTKHENETVGVSELCELYPVGFYDEESFINYIDNYIKPHKVKWAEIYGPKESR